MAGLSSTDQGCVVVTQRASAPLSMIHHRQPVLLNEEHVWRWLDGAEMSDSPPRIEITYHPVTTRVGNTRHDDSELIMPVDVDMSAQVQTGELFPDG